MQGTTIPVKNFEPTVPAAQSMYENYDITDMHSDDSTDDESCPKRPIPDWAQPTVLSKHVALQEARVASQVVDIAKIFPPEQLLKTPDLARIFSRKRQRFFVRSSSAHWKSPMLKKTKVG